MAEDFPVVEVPPVAEAPEPVLPPLTARRAQFVQEYIIDLNGQQAAIRAGYAAASAGVEAVRLLNDARVAAAIDKLKAQRATRVGVTQASVLHEMSLLANSSIDHYFIDDNGNIMLTEGAPEGAMGAIKSKKHRKITKIDKDDRVTVTHEVEIQLWDKPGSLKLMGRHIGLFPDKVELSGPGGSPLELVTRVERVVIDAKPNV